MEGIQYLILRKLQATGQIICQMISVIQANSSHICFPAELPKQTHLSSHITAFQPWRFSQFNPTMPSEVEAEMLKSWHFQGLCLGSKWPPFGLCMAVERHMPSIELLQLVDSSSICRKPTEWVEDVTGWWAKKRNEHLDLQRIGFGLLVTPALSAECERIFSSTKRLLTDPRNGPGDVQLRRMGFGSIGSILERFRRRWLEFGPRNGAS
jgi:hypothetical protein